MSRQERAAIDESAWDGPAAMSGCLKMDDPAAAFNAICAGKKKGDPKTAEAHALPHHKHPGDPPNKKGVTSALGYFDQTDGLTNKAAAKTHLENHQKLWKENAMAQPQSRREAGAPTGARMQAFPSEMRAELVTRDGKSFYHVEGFATTFNQQYEMWDMFGPYKEGVRGYALDKSLSAKPDVAFLTNHRGVTMARTTNDTLTLEKDPSKGLGIDALLNAERQDVKDVSSAIRDKLVTEMSFAFMLLNGEWEWADETGREFDEFWITEADINRGDVSAVNYGANPYTSIEARTPEWLSMLDRMSKPVLAEALSRIASRKDADELQQAAEVVSTQRKRSYFSAAADMSAESVERRKESEEQEPEFAPAESPAETRKAVYSLDSAMARWEHNKET